MPDTNQFRKTYTKVIYKYEFDETGDDIKIPGGQVLMVAQQGNRIIPTLWVEHELDDDANLPAEVMRFRIEGTGKPFDHQMVHIGSAVCGHLVWHVYRVS